MSQNFDFWSKKTPFSIFVDPAHCLGFVGDIHHLSNYPNRTDDPDDPDGVIVQSYIDRLRNVSSFYTYLTDRGDTRDEMGTYYTGWTGFLESHARTPPEDRRNVMIDVQQDWALKSLTTPNFYVTNIDPDNVGAGITFGYGPDATGFYDPANASGITFPPIPTEWRNDSRVIAEFTRQANMGVPYLSGGLTPGSQGATMGTYKSVAKRLFNDMAEYVRSRGTDNVVQFTDFGASLVGDTSYVPSVALRSQIASGGKSWWRRSFWHPNLSDSVNYSKEKGVLDDLADASLSADMYGGSVFNWFPNMGDEIAEGAWYAAAQRLVDAGGGVSSAAATNFDLDDLNYWAAKGAGSLLHEYYNHVDGLATSRSNPSYRKGLAMVVQLDAPVVAQPNEAGGGVYAAQKWGYMKDHNLAAQIDILGAFGATDANAPNLRKPDQIWVKSSAWYNNKLLFEAGTGNYADASFLGFPDDNYTSRFAVLTARNQVEKRLFKRPIMQREASVGTSEEDILQQLGLDDASPEAQATRLTWLETNTLPNVYWDARVGEEYTEGASNNIRFWSATTGNCLPSPCVFDTTSPIAAFLNMNNDIYKNDVRVAFKKWVSENNVQAIEAAYRSLINIYFTPVVQQKDIPIFADPDLLVGWNSNEAGYLSESGAQPYIRRILKAATPYTYISYGSGAFGAQSVNYEPTVKYFDALYGVSAHAEEQTNFSGTSLQQQIFTNGIRGGKSLPPFLSRAVMFNSEYPWNSIFGAQSRTLDLDGLTNSFGISLINRQSTIDEFARQASLGLDYLFPVASPIGGLTPGSQQVNIGVYRSVGERLWNDLSHYAKNNSTPMNTARNVLHYVGAPFQSVYGVLRSGAREDGSANIPANRSYWRSTSDYLKTFDMLYEIDDQSWGQLESVHAAQMSADAQGYIFYNDYPSHPDWATGATFWFSDFNVAPRKLANGTLAPSDYSWSDTLYWQTCEMATAIGNLKKNLLNRGHWSTPNEKKIAALVAPQTAFEGTSASFIIASEWNHWGGGRKNPTLAGTVDMVSMLRQADQYNTVVSPPDEIWVWTATSSYWIDIPTRSIILTSNPRIAWTRNTLEKVLFQRPNYPTELKELMESDGLSMDVSGTPYRSDIQQRQEDWLFDNCLTDGWWSRSPLGSEVVGSSTIVDNRTWWDPNSGGNQLPSPCVIDQSSPLAPWLNFDVAITTGDIHNAIRHYISDYNCKYVESLRDTLRRLQP